MVATLSSVVTFLTAWISTFLTGATVTPPALSDIIDSGLIGTLKNIYIEITTLFTIFPVNIFLTLTIVSIAIALISKVVSSFRAAN